jgi:hypothetical protein
MDLKIRNSANKNKRRDALGRRLRTIRYIANEREELETVCDLAEIDCDYFIGKVRRLLNGEMKTASTDYKKCVRDGTHLRQIVAEKPLQNLLRNFFETSNISEKFLS